MRFLLPALALAVLVAAALLGGGSGPFGAGDLRGGSGVEDAQGHHSKAADERGTADAPAVLAGRPAPPVPLAQGRCGVHGVVRDARSGQPVAGVPVHAIYSYVYEWGHLLASTVAEADGSYALRDLEPCLVPVFVVALGRGWIPERGLDPDVYLQGERRWRVGLRREAWAEHDLRVVPGARVAGEVLLPDGRPAVGATVFVSSAWNGGQSPTHDGFPWAAVPELRTDTAGRFVLDALPPSRGTVFHAGLEGYRGTESDPMALTREKTARIVLRFDDRRDVDVLVLDAVTGHPVARVDVGIGGETRSRPTGRDGRVRLEGVPRSGLRIEAEASGYAAYASEGDAWKILIRRDEEGHEFVEIRLEPEATLRGQVSCPEGLDPGRVRVLVEALAVPGHERFQRDGGVDTDGRFAIVVPSKGRFVVSMSERMENCDYEAPSVEAEPGGPGVVLSPRLTWTREIVLPDSGKTWRLTLLGPVGLPLAGASFRRGFPPHRYDIGVRHALDFENGVVQLDVGPGTPGTWLFVLEPRTASGVAAGTVCLGPFDDRGGERTVRLPVARRLEGRILDDGGRPVAGVEVRACPVPPRDAPANARWGGVLAAGVSDKRGRFVLANLGVDEVDLDVWAWPDFLLPPRVRARVGTDDALVRLRPSVTARVRVLLPDGKPAAHAKIQVTCVEGVRCEAMQGNVWRFREYRTDTSGEIRIEGLDPDASYDLRIEPHWKPPGLQWKRIESWRPQDTAFRLERRACLAGVAVDGAGIPQGGVAVYLRDGEGEIHEVGAGWGGAFTFDDLPPGPVKLGAQHGPARKNTDGLFTVAAQADDEDVQVVVESRRDLRIVFPEGDPGRTQHLRMRITRRDGAGEGPRTDTHYDNDGEFLFRGLEPQARYWVWAGPTETGRHVYLEVPPGVEEVEARLVPGGVVQGTVVLPPKAVHAWVAIQERGIVTRAKIRGDGSFDLIGIPPGTWTVEAECETNSGERTARGTAAAGESVDLDLTVP